MGTLSNKPKSDYNCEQEELYAIAEIGWKSCKVHVADFFTLKQKYTTAFIDARLAEIAAAKLMPSFMIRNANVHEKVLALKRSGAVCIENWNALERYIADAYSEDEELYETRLQQAGKYYYEEASNEDWEKLHAMILAGKTFIADYSAELLADNNMPVGFGADYEGFYDTYKQDYDVFMDKTELKEELSSSKLTANNKLYKTLMKMFTDGQHIFRKNAAVRERFTFIKVKELVSSNNSGGKVLKVFEGTLLALALINLGVLPTGAKKLRVSVVLGGPLEFGLSVDGTTFNGNTVSIAGVGSEVVLIVDLNSLGNLILVLNQNAIAEGAYKVEVLG